MDEKKLRAAFRRAGSYEGAALELGISRETVRRRLAELGITSPTTGARKPRKQIEEVPAATRRKMLRALERGESRDKAAAIGGVSRHQVLRLQAMAGAPSRRRGGAA